MTYSLPVLPPGCALVGLALEFLVIWTDLCSLTLGYFSKGKGVQLYTEVFGILVRWHLVSYEHLIH